ncbi:hypothetical protein [Pedobacter sp. N23S346]|uniref:hypothetical protein n=1 Tax=Pedobacter sp. N23S346 TaxID=3402750 RepID=UPI003AC6656D
MAIKKQCTNMSIRVRTDYKLIAGNNIQKIADHINVEARLKNLFLVSNKKVVGQGGKSS